MTTAPHPGFAPDWYCPPGYTIDTALKERNISTEIFAEIIGQTTKFVGKLLRGLEPVSPELAECLAEKLGSTKQFWLRREARYQQDKERMDKLGKILSDIERAGMKPEVKPAPHDAQTFDQMILVWLPRHKPFLYQVHLWDSGEGKIVGTFK